MNVLDANKKGMKLLLAVFCTLLIVLTLPKQTLAADTAFYEPLNAMNSNMFYASNNWANGPGFGVGWKASNLEFNNGIMALRLDNMDCPSSCSGKNFASGEYATKAKYGYGRVEARFKAAKGEGLVTSLFTYENVDEKSDEIDIEILGKNTTRLETNYFTKGAGDHSTIINLGFDAAEDFHNYAFEWSPTYIKWFVDDKLVHTETGTRGALPTNPGHIMVNLWSGAGSTTGWTGEFTYPGTPIRAAYDWIKFTPADQLPKDDGTGLTAQYYDDMNFTTLKATRTDATVNFDWGLGAPMSSMGADTFSVRWTGKVKPKYTGTYTFYTSSDDGVRLWVNNQLVINKWIDQPETEWSGTIDLTAGQKYDIKLEFYDNAEDAIAKLYWSSASQPKQIVPQIRLYPN
ncbi:family 16 glycosylhydrolase [Paenibacillus elgii]|uniref:family 16 glycosylhydrolase n=1 Tax=Paenibacillus elgii TaxID=189691 RepID=UPI00203D729B|nr:family 16 glycosylhydrolase [Paenibacillus elgii]MCM3271812.1 family 16 glycosylhydrolase [Paenibacillus elgii]